MSQPQRKQDLRLLELEPDASDEEITQAYRRLLGRYGPGRLPSYGLLHSEGRRTLLRALEAAYQRLLGRPPSTPPPSRSRTPSTSN